MKNIHILPTDQPTGIFETNSGLQFSIMNKVRHGEFKGFHIYITSDEEIKDGDWMIRGNEQPTLVTPNFFWDFGVRYYKIILTTDPTLISDGVQSIDNEFLEWFVKNSSCEFVEVGQWAVPNGYETDSNGRAMSVCRWVWKITIPQEEPKQEKKPHSFCETPEEKCTMNYCDDNGCQNRKRHLVEPYEQKTLEEAVERMYSEEDMSKSFFQGWVTRERFDDQIPDIIYPKGLDYEEKQEYAFNLWFEQFKKK